MQILINFISIADLFFLSKAFKYEFNNYSIPGHDNMAAVLFLPVFYIIIAVATIIINIILGIAGLLYLKNTNLKIKDFFFLKNDNLALKIIKVTGYCFIFLYYTFAIDTLINADYFELLFFILAILNTFLYVIWTVAVAKGFLSRKRK